MGFNSKFLIQNRFGVFYYQKRVPNLVRLSLGTKSKKEAIKLARLITVMWDLRAQQYFANETSYHKGIKLFQEYLKAVSKYKN
jgi:hypothetical protein